MSVKKSINRALLRTTGYQLVRTTSETAVPVRRAARLLEKPVFVLSSIRSGSTLLRVMLGSHSQLYAPHELHLSGVTAKTKSWFAKAAMSELGFDQDELTRLMWDRLLDEALRRSGKPTLVEKTPSDLLMYERIASTWPDARFVFLLRHPGSIYESWHDARPDMETDAAVEHLLQYLDKLEQARKDLPGIDVKYEDLTSDPEAQTRRLCAYLGLDWEPGMLEYGEKGHTRFTRGLGDWSSKINSGRPQAPRPLPDLDDVPKGLHGATRAFGYCD